jgi:dTMP kinase
MPLMNRGKFIVIEGTDGTGKTTQTAMLIDRLKKTKLPIETTDFPQYDNFSGAFVAKYLRGEYGSADEVGPYRGSVFYAVDRYDKSFEIKKWLNEGKVIVSNRYVSANMGHQTGKIKGKRDRDKYLDWLETLEYEIFDIPRPHITILLYMPVELSQQLVDKKAARAYTNGKKRDIHEDDINHLRNAHEAYLYVAKKYDWALINCFEKNRILTPDEVHEKIFTKVKRILKLK